MRLRLATALLLAFPASAAAAGNGVPAVTSPVPYDGGSVTAGGSVVACPGDARTFRPAATDPDPGAPPTFQWSTGATGSPLTLTAGRTATITVVATSGVDGDLSAPFSFAFGAAAPATAALTASSTTPRRRQAVTLSTSVTSPCATTLGWDLDGDGDYDDATGSPITYTPQAAGASITLRARAADGAGPGASRQITLRTPANRAPTGKVALGRPDLLLGEATTLAATDLADVDGDIVRIEWDFDGDGGTDAVGPTATIRATRAGQAPVVRLIDDLGGVRTYKVGVTTFGAPAVQVAPAVGTVPGVTYPAGTVIATYAGTDGRQLTNEEREQLRQTGGLTGITLAVPLLVSNVREEQVELFVAGKIAKRLGLGGDGRSPVTIASGGATQAFAVGPGTPLAVAVTPTPSGKRVFARIRRLAVAVRVTSRDGTGAPVVSALPGVLAEEKRNVRVRGKLVSRVHVSLRAARAARR